MVFASSTMNRSRIPNHGSYTLYAPVVEEIAVYFQCYALFVSHEKVHQVHFIPVQEEPVTNRAVFRRR